MTTTETSAAEREERLRQLRRVIEAAHEDRLHMGRWSDLNAPCGTSYCAAGWAVTDPWFRANTKIGAIFNLTVTPRGIQVTARGWSTLPVFDKLAAVFHIGVADARRLFGLGLTTAADSGDPHVVSKAEVLDNIDRLLRGEHAVAYAATAAGGYR